MKVQSILTTIILTTCVSACGCNREKSIASKPSRSVNFDSLTVLPKDRPEGQDFDQGRAILEASRRAYSSIATYDGTIALSAVGKFPGQTFQEQRNLKVHFEQPGNLQIRGSDSNNDRFIIEITSDSASIDWNNRTQKFTEGRDALAAFSGITLYGSLVLPGCLLDVVWKNEDYVLPMNKSLFEAWSTKARLDGSESIDGHECQRIVCERETITWTLYVDYKTKLLRRADCEITPANMERLKNEGAHGGASGNLLGLSRSQLFSIDDVTFRDDVSQ